MVSGSSTIEFGTRNLALHSALSHRTVSRVLRILRDEPDPLIDLVSPRRMARADRYALRIPDRYADSVRWRRRRAGRVEAIHPVFLILGGAAGAGVSRRSARTRHAAPRWPGRPGWRRRQCRPRSGCSLSTVSPSGARADGAAVPSPWPTSPSRPARPGCSGSGRTRYRQDRESWRARLRTYQGARQPPVTSRDGWWPLDDADEYDEVCRWPVLSDDFVRGPPAPERRHALRRAGQIGGGYAASGQGAGDAQPRPRRMPVFSREVPRSATRCR